MIDKDGVLNYGKVKGLSKMEALPDTIKLLLVIPVVLAAILLMAFISIRGALLLLSMTGII